MLRIEYHYAYQDNWGGWNNTWVDAAPGKTFKEIFEALGKSSWHGDYIPLKLRWPSYAWPGGYPIFYVVQDGGVLCHRCANAELDRTLDSDDDQFYIVDSSINYEDHHLFCDHCGSQIEAAYPQEENQE